MSFFDFSDVKWSGEWAPAAFFVVMFCVAHWTMPIDRRWRRGGVLLGGIVLAVYFSVEWCLDRHANGRQVRCFLRDAVFTGAAATLFVWVAKPTALMYWEDGKAIVAWVRRWKTRLRSLTRAESERSMEPGKTAANPGATPSGADSVEGLATKHDDGPA